LAYRKQNFFFVVFDFLPMSGVIIEARRWGVKNWLAGMKTTLCMSVHMYDYTSGFIN
jgi:hypothetical protein